MKTYAIGLMSGTSVDGIDAALVEILQNQNGDNSHTAFNLILGQTTPVPKEIKAEIFNLFSDPRNGVSRLTLLNMRLGELYGQAVRRLLAEAKISPDQVAVIGSHGQTIWHAPLPESFAGSPGAGTLQIGEGSVIALLSGITTVSDFRTSDMAAGGYGAPLVPILECELAAGFGSETAFLNIGGISNISYFTSAESNPIAFDTGPGNMILDRLVFEHTRGSNHYDRDGQFSSEGTVISSLLDHWMNHPYLKQRPPKTSGREMFGDLFWAKEVKPLLKKEVFSNLLRTTVEFTIRSITGACRDLLPGNVETLVVTGGGAHHPLIMDGLKTDLTHTQVLTGDEAGISTDFKEAIAFAWLGWLAINRKAGNVPSATGAVQPMVLGKISYPPPK